MGDNRTQDGLKRRLGLFELTTTGIGIIVGAGIYVIIGKAAGMAGGAVWASFLLGALAATFTGLSYAELSSRYPRAAASYEYTRRAFGKRAGFATGWLILFATIIASSAVSIGFAGYLTSFVDVPVVPVAIGLVLLSGAVLIIGVREAVWVGVLFTLLEVGGLVVVIGFSAAHFGEGEYLEIPAGLLDVFRAATLLFFAYTGFEQLATLSEEAKNPKKMMPLAIIGAIGVTTVLYVLVGFSAVSVLDWQVLSGSSAPLADVVESAANVSIARAIGYIALFATANTALFLLLTGSRMLYGMSRCGSLPGVLGRVLKSRGTPWVATLVAVGLAIVFVLPGDIEVVAQMTNFATIAAFALVNAALVWVRLSKPREEGGFRIPLNVRGVPVTAVAGVIIAILMLATMDWQVLGYGLLILALGIGLPFVMERLKIILPPDVQPDEAVEKEPSVPGG
ncbi:MAG: amino acid permease [SAR202 cluster bacterium]|nr:amino acid permease [SAR202 cluster bacterium]